MKLMHRAVAAATIITSVGVVGFAGSALAGPCEARSTAASFAPWGDMNQYFVADGGTFEDGSTPWKTWGDAEVNTSQSPWSVNGKGHARAMRVPERSGIVSPSICVYHDEESIRFFYRAPRGGGDLQVTIDVTSTQGTATNTTVVSATRRGWDVSPVIDLPNLRDESGQQWITITIAPVDMDDTWLIDDVMIDPWVAR